MSGTDHDSETDADAPGNLTTMNRTAKHAFLTTASLVFAGIAFSPAIHTIWWRFRNQGEIEYVGAHFVVPARWSARISPAAVHFEKRPLTVFSHQVLMAWAALAPVPNPPRTNIEREEFYASFAALYSTKLAGDQEVQDEPFRIGTEQREAFCMQSVLKNRKDWFRTTCLISRGTWRASFEGGPTDKENFFREVLGLPDPKH